MSELLVILFHGIYVWFIFQKIVKLFRNHLLAGIPLDEFLEYQLVQDEVCQADVFDALASKEAVPELTTAASDCFMMGYACP